MRILVSLASLLLLIVAFGARADEWPAERRFRDVYKELVETNTTHSVGSCTLAAERMAARLKAGGVPAADLHLFVPPGVPLDGGLVVVYPGRDPKARAVLLLAHLDVVEANREDWTRDPFTLVEENGEFYARGARDDKAEAAIWVDTLLRFRDEHYEPRHTVKVALTCGEESGARLNGAGWLVEHERDLIDAGLALNEGGGGELDTVGRHVALLVEAAEKTAQSFKLEITNPGGHSSRPVKDNAIYRLARALTRIEDYQFPAELDDANRAYFAGMARLEAVRDEGEVAAAMEAFVRDPGAAAALALVSARDPGWNAMLRTTCVATMLEGGHALNALPQRASASINCRMFPGTTTAEVKARLESLVADAGIRVTALPLAHPPAPAPPLTKAFLAPIEKLAAEYWPGVPVLPYLMAGGTDGTLTNLAGIPTFGVEPVFAGADLGNVHGLNEHVGVTSLFQGREFLYRLVKAYADAPEAP